MMFSVLIATWLAAPLYLQIGGALSAVFIVGATALSFNYLFSKASERLKKWITPEKPKMVEPEPEPVLLKAQNIKPLAKPVELQMAPVKRVQKIALKPVCIDPILKKESAQPSILDRVITLREIVEIYDIPDRKKERAFTKKQRQYKIEKKVQSKIKPIAALKLIKNNSLQPIRLIQPALVLKEEATIQLQTVAEPSVDKNELDPMPITNVRQAIVFEKFEKNETPASGATDTKQESTVDSFPLILSLSVFRFSPVVNFAMYPLFMKGKSVEGQEVGARKRQVGMGARRGGRDLLQDKHKVVKAHTALVPFAPPPKPLIFQLNNRQPQFRVPSLGGARSLASIARTAFRLFRK